MRKRRTIDELFNGRHFEQEISVLCVRRLVPALQAVIRDLVEMMAERGLTMSHTIIFNIAVGESASCQSSRSAVRTGQFSLDTLTVQGQAAPDCN
jgi:transposase-like protein